MTTQIENERKFLMLSGFAEYARHHDSGLELYINQGYFAIVNDVELRVRKYWNKAWAKGALTLKTGQGQVREENTMEIDCFAAESLFETSLWKLIKVRHRIFDRWEVDVYIDRHKGLVVAEIEKLDAETDDEFNKLELPSDCKPYLIREVTMEDAFKNKNLAVYVKTPK